jgi:hypothetical protein
MIEVATGAAFLLSSLYGAGQANAETVPVVAAAPVIEQATTSEITDIEGYVSKEYADEPILVEVARCESTFRQFGKDGRVIRGKVNPQDVGVMQINERYHADEAAAMGLDIYTVEGNVDFAKHLYDKFGTDPWSSSEKCWSRSTPLAQK